MQFIALGILLLLFQASCKQKQKIVVDPAFSAYISAYTSGVISREATIRVQLNNDVAEETDLNKAIEKNLFEFSPSIKGTA
jgi:alpha-2-macroglobulin